MNKTPYQVRFNNIAVFIFLTLIGLVFYFPILNTPFFSDDFNVLTRVANGDLMAKGFLRPLSDFSIYLDYLIWKNNAFGFHLTSVVIHIITTFLLFLFAQKILKYLINEEGIKMVAFWIALLFLIYPFHNETIVWIVGRGILLATTFAILSSLLYINGKGWQLLASSILFFVGLLGYESIVCLPLLLFLLDWLVIMKNFRASLLKSLFTLIPLVVYLGLKVIFAGGIIGGDGYYTNKPGAMGFLMNFFRLIERSFVCPLKEFKVAIICISLIVLFIVVVVAIKLDKSAKRKVVVAGLLFLISLLPVTIVGIDTHDTEGERFLYFPSVFLCLFVVLLFYKAFRKWHSIMLAVTSVYYLVFLDINNNNWIVAGKVIESIANDMASERRKVLILDLPDNYRGAFIFRNGFENSFKVLQRPGPAAVTVLSKKELNSANSLQEPWDDNGRFLITKSNQGLNITDRPNGTIYNTNENEEALYVFDKGHLILK